MKVLCQWNKAPPPTLSSPQQHLISTLFTKDCKKLICFCEWLITIWHPQVHPGCMRILFPVMTLQHGWTTFCLRVNGYLSSSYSFPPRNCHTILPQWAHLLPGSTTLCRSPVSPILPTFLNFFFWTFCLFSVFHEPLRQCHERLIWGWAVNCHLQSAAWICMEVISRII